MADRTVWSAALPGFHGPDVILELADLVFQLVEPGCRSAPSVWRVDWALGGSAPRVSCRIAGVRDMGSDQDHPPLLKVGQLVLSLRQGEMVLSRGAQLLGGRP